MARKAQNVYVVLTGSIRGMIDDMARVKKSDPNAEGWRAPTKDELMTLVYRPDLATDNPDSKLFLAPLPTLTWDHPSGYGMSLTYLPSPRESAIWSDAVLLQLRFRL